MGFCSGNSGGGLLWRSPGEFLGDAVGRCGVRRRLVWLAEGRSVERLKKVAGKGSKDLYGFLFQK